MDYTETRIYTTSQGAEPVMAILISHNIDNFTVEDPRDIRELIDNKGTVGWDFMDESLMKKKDSNEAIITFYTDDTDESKAILQNIKLDLMKLKSDELYGKYGGDSNFGRMYAESKLLNEDWKERWKEWFKPIKVTESIVIKPSWEEYEQNIDELVIEIDPAMAFGTGSHETTRSCIKLLEQVMEPEFTVLDIGTGTGILAIVAALCGASEVDAYEIDTEACDAAKKNVAINGVDVVINVINGDILKEESDKEYDVILANLTSGVIKKLLPIIKKNIKEGGTMILSGILAEEKDEMETIFMRYDMEVIEEIIDGEWYTVRV